MAQVALAWLRNRAVPVIPILGARKLSQLQDNLASFDLGLSPEQNKILDDASHIDLGFPQEMYAKEFPVASATVACVTKLPPDSTFGVRGLLPRSSFGSAFSRTRKASF